MALFFPPFQFAVDRFADEGSHAAVADQLANPLSDFLGKPDERRFVA